MVIIVLAFLAWIGLTILAVFLPEGKADRMDEAAEKAFMVFWFLFAPTAGYALGTMRQPNLPERDDEETV